MTMHGCPEHAWIHYHVSPYVAVTGHGDILDVGCLLACRSLPLIYDHFSYRNVVDPAIRLWISRMSSTPLQHVSTSTCSHSCTRNGSTTRALSALYTSSHACAYIVLRRPVALAHLYQHH